jgi:hypothetical protein
MKEPMSWLFALGLENVTQSDEDAEKLGRQLTQVVLEDSPGDFDQASLTLLWATFLGRRASALCRTGNPRAAVAVFREATAVFHEAISLLGTMRFASESTTKEWIDKLKIRMWELESERAACLIRDGRLVDAERILLEAHRNLPEGGQRQIARARLVELYERQQKDTQAARWKAGRLPIALNDVRNLGPVVFSSQGSGVYPIVSVPLGGRTAWAAVHVGGVPFAGMGSSSVWGWLDSKTLGSGRVVIDESVHASYLKELLQPPANGVSPPAPSTGRERRVYRLKSTVPDPERQRAFAFYDWVTLGLTYEHLTPFGDRDEEVSGALGGTSLAVWRDPEESARLQVGSGGGDRLVFGDDEPRWGDAALRAETWLYAYACDPFKGCLLGRVPFDQVLQRNAWTFYTRSGVWLSDWRKAQPVPGLNNVDHLSVQWNGYLGQYLAILSKEESSFDDDVKIRFSVAARPEGPWSAPFAELASAQVVVGTTRAVGHHPEMAQDNGRIEYLTYVPPGDVKVHVIQVTFERSDRP